MIDLDPMIIFPRLHFLYNIFLNFDTLYLNVFKCDLFYILSNRQTVITFFSYISHWHYQMIRAKRGCIN